MSVHPRADSATSILGIDHLALRVGDREGMARFLVEHLGMQQVDSADDHMALAPAGGGTKLVLREGGRASEPGVLARLVLRVSDLDGALSRLPSGAGVERTEPELALLEGPEGLGLGLTSVLGGAAEFDLDHLVLRAMDPEETTVVLAELGFVPRGEGLHVGDKHVRIDGRPGAAEEGPALAHIGVQVESLGAVEAQARAAGVEVERPDPETLCVHVRGPEQIRLHYSERRRSGSEASGQPETAPPGTAATGFPEPPGPGSTDPSEPPHRVLSNPVGEPDPTEWPDPYEHREDPRDPPDPDGQPFGEEPHAPTGSTSTSEPHPDQDIEADPTQPPERDNLDD